MRKRSNSTYDRCARSTVGNKGRSPHFHQPADFRNAVATVICPVCRANTIATKLKCHVEKHIGQSRFRCTICRKKFVFKWEIDHHLKERHQIDPEVGYWTEASDFEENPRLRLKCILCDETMRTREAIITHAKYHNLCRERKHIGKDEAEELLKCKLEAMDVGCAIETHFDPPGQREWVCPLCKAKKFLFAELNVHMLEHQGARFVCRACPFSFATHREAVRHIAQKHPHRTPGLHLSKPDEFDLFERLNTTCALCNAEIKNLKTLERHIALHNTVQIAEETSEEEKPQVEEQPDYEFICCICKQSLRKRANLTMHLSQHFKEYRYRCRKCGSGFVWRRSVVRHVENYHSTEKDLIEVLGPHTSENNDFRCSICHEELPDKKSVYMHTELHSDTKTSRLPEPICICPLCNKTVERWGLMKSHIGKHLEVHKFLCLHCDDETYPSIAALNHHLREKHEDLDLETGYRRISEIPQGDLNLQCVVCSGKMSSERKILKHAENHSKSLNLSSIKHQAEDPLPRLPPGEKPLACPICRARTAGREKLKHHIHAHWYQTFFKCSLCPREFTVLADLAAHSAQEHSGAAITPTERVEEHAYDTLCMECGEKITCKKETKVHAFLHNFHSTGQFSCTLCFKTFPSLNEWTEHKKTASCARLKYKVIEWIVVS